jgi:hypothetical protein
MEPCQSNAGEVLRAPDVTDAKRGALGGEGLEAFAMIAPRAPASRQPAGLADHGDRVAQENEIFQTERSGNGQRLDQRQPFGVQARALTDVTPNMFVSCDDDRGFHHSGVGAAASVEVDLYARWQGGVA